MDTSELIALVVMAAIVAAIMVLLRKVERHDRRM
ncbi:hypothetical protein BH23PLA1_BH23PLA1_32120 [soil metagenome]